MGGNYPTAVTCHGRKFWHSSIRRITCAINSRIRNALKKFIDLHSLLVRLDTGSRKIKVIEICDSARAVHHQVGLELALAPSCRSANHKISVPAFDPGRHTLKFNLDAELTRLTHKAINQVRIKLLKWTL